MPIVIGEQEVIYISVLRNRYSSSSIGKHFRVKHGSIPKDISENFSVLKKCKNKFDCLVAEMFLIKEMKPSLNVQFYLTVF